MYLFTEGFGFGYTVSNSNACVYSFCVSVLAFTAFSVLG